MTTPVFYRWAVSLANYPAGGNPWNGQPLRVAPAGDYFTPNTSVPAEVLNYVLGQAFDDISEVARLPVQNFHAPIPVASIGLGGAITTASRDPKNAVSFLGTWDGSNTKINYSSDATGWSVLGTVASHQVRVMGAHGTNGGVLCLPSGDNLRFVDSAGVTHDTGTSLGTATDGIAFWYPAQSKILLVAYATGGCAAVTTPDGVTITSVTSSLPASWTSTTFVWSKYSFAINPTGDTAVIAFGGATPGTDHSRLLKVTNPSGVLTFTDLTIPVPTMSVRGIAYNPSLALWGFIAYDGTNSVFYTSPDLSTWTLVNTFTSQRCTGLACVGNTWILGGQFSIAGSTTARLQLSQDGATWSWAGAIGFSANDIGSIGIGLLQCEGSSVLAYSGNAAQGSLSF